MSSQAWASPAHRSEPHRGAEGRWPPQTHTAQTRSFSASPSPVQAHGQVWLTCHGTHVPLLPDENLAEKPCHRMKGTALDGHSLCAGSICSDSRIMFLSQEGCALVHLSPTPCAPLISRFGGRSLPGALLRALPALPHLICMTSEAGTVVTPIFRGYSAGEWLSFPDNRKGVLGGRLNSQSHQVSCAETSPLWTSR